MKTALDWKLDIVVITAAATWSQTKIVRLTKRLNKTKFRDFRFFDKKNNGKIFCMFCIFCIFCTFFIIRLLLSFSFQKQITS